MTKTNWNLLNDFESMSREMNRLFDQVWKGRGLPPNGRNFPGASLQVYPAINAYEDRDQVVIEALAPGLDPDTLKIRVDRNQLTIEGEKKSGIDEKPEGKWDRLERAVGKFVRTLSLPQVIDQEKIVAGYQDGVLRLTLPKLESAKPRQIEVNFN